jgi:hypothetical protein
MSRERVIFFEIDQPLCSLTYGTGACPAVLGTDSDHKCFNTRGTCPVPGSYLPESGSPPSPNVLTLRFALGQLDLLQYGYVIPSLIGEPDTTPGKINLGGMDRNVSALGSREVVSVKFADHLHSDLLVDPYRLERISGAAMFDPLEAYDPALRGSFWGKWLARNPYYQHYACRVREGYLGDALDDMEVRHYLIDRIDGPDDDGTVSLTAKDLFSLIEARKAQAPLASRGELAAAINASVMSATLSPTGIGNLDYPTAGYIAIGDEEIQFTRSGDALTFVARGTSNTVATAHDEEDLVQLVLVVAAQRAHDIVYTLLDDYTAVDAATQIDAAQWDIEAAQLTQVYSAHITKPTPVVQLIGELSEQAGFTVWPDVSTGLINFAPLRAQAPTTVVDDAGWIADGSLSLKRQVAKRVSQVWVYYGQINPVEDLDERRNYHSRVVVSPTENLYATEGIVEIFSRWIPQFGRSAATQIGERRLAMFSDAPLEAGLEGHASRAAEVALARYFTLRVAEVQDATGATADVTMAAVEIEPAGDRVNVTAQQVRFYTEPGDTGERVIYIENSIFDANLRTIHDSLYAAPVGGSPGEVVRFVILPGIVVGASSTGGFALDTGDWPAGVGLQIEWAGDVSGKGGNAGRGGQANFAGAGGTTAGQAGGAGGKAFKARYPVIVSGDGLCQGGGGGGGGGGATSGSLSAAGVVALLGGGSGGGGGAGSATGSGGGGGSGAGSSGAAGAAGTLAAGGSRGTTNADGGNGGGPAVAGSAGQSGTGTYGTAGGAGGAAGAAIEGIAFVTFTGSPGVTVIGSTS